MNNFDHILADHDDVRVHGTILYAKKTDLSSVYSDKRCKHLVSGETLKDIYLKGCVVAIVKNGVVCGPYVKPAVLDITPDGYKLAISVEEVLEGDGSEYYTLAPTSLTFRSKAPLSELQEVQINGETVDPSNYTLTEGSTIVTFPVDYLKSLEVGQYEVSVVSASKTAKGSFIVTSPNLNEYGFYYNQPYVGYVAPYSRHWVFFMREGGVMDVIILEDNQTMLATYVIDGSDMTVTTEYGETFTGSITPDGIYCNEVMVTFAIGNDKIAADDYYLYVYEEAVGGYVVKVIDREKSEYGPIKTGINGIDTKIIPAEAFRECVGLTHIDIPNGVTTIEESAFFGCENLESVNIPDSVSIIGENAFGECTSLTNVNIPDGVTELICTFYGCTSLTNVNIPDSVTTIGMDAFRYCTSLTNVNIPDSVSIIGENAFDGCTSLTNVNIPDGVTELICTFYGCTSLTNVNIPDGVTKLYGTFHGCTSLTNVNIPDSVSIIGENAFYGCTSLTNVNIPDGVTTIRLEAFRYCTSLTNVNIPDSVTTIGMVAFEGCTSLTNITFRGTVDQWNAITKDPKWHNGVPARNVQCSDGVVGLWAL